MDQTIEGVSLQKVELERLVGTWGESKGVL
jgi:hypothetical protein